MSENRDRAPTMFPDPLTSTTAPFHPPPLLRHRHLQSVLASIGLRRPAVRRRCRAVLDRSVPRILDRGTGVRLMGLHAAHGDRPRDLAVLIHGWEGSADSLYLVSAAGHLFSRGFDVFRLNLRDHGPTHHLNRGLFHACRIDEVVDAVKTVADCLAHRHLFLGGFSLGGNFALRVAVRAPAAGIPLRRAVAVCPVLDPVRTMDVLETGPAFYHDYFLRKWRRSLRRKRELFPDLADIEDLGRFRSLREMTDAFAPGHTGFPTADAYLSGYAIVGPALSELTVPSHLILSADDPVIPADDLARLARPPALSVTVTRYGGHCGFLDHLFRESWAERRMARWFVPAPSPKGEGV